MTWLDEPYPACPRAREHHLMASCGGCGYPAPEGCVPSRMEKVQAVIVPEQLDQYLPSAEPGHEGSSA